jgi:CheY-like chemotaxis protein
MAGTIKVTSVPGEGTTFSVYLPMVLRPAPAVPRSELLRDLNILIVDDNATNRCIVQHYLSNEGLRHESVASAEEALQTVRAGVGRLHAFDVILLDYQMPGTDGIGFLRALQADPAVASIPCIVLSSLGERVQEANLPQIAAWLTKPIRKAQLLQVIAGVMDRKPRAQPALAKAVPPNRYTRSRVLLVEDNPVNQLVASRLLKTLGIEPQIAENGKKAVHMIQQHTFDLVLMDCQMPEMDGYEATQAVRVWEKSVPATGSKRRLPVVALTANALVGDRERCAAAGMDGYLSKPITRDALSTLVRQWLTPDSPALGQSAAGS